MTQAMAATEGAASGVGSAAIARTIALLLPLALLGGALGSQYLGGLNPCEMCYWQRWPHGAAIVLAALSFTAQASSPRARTLTFLAASAIAASGAIGVFHAGVEYGWWEGLTQCSTSGGPATLESIVNAPLVRCDQVQWSLAGISMAGWNALLSLGGAAAILTLLAKALSDG
jgi:disulfide bond formation protein DsbB